MLTGPSLETRSAVFYMFQTLFVVRSLLDGAQYTPLDLRRPWFWHASDSRREPPSPASRPGRFEILKHLCRPRPNVPIIVGVPLRAYNSETLTPPEFTVEGEEDG